MPGPEDCAAVRAALRRGAGDPALREHLATCEACAALARSPGLLGALDALGAAPAPDVAALTMRLDARLAAERGPSAWLLSRPTWLRLAVALAAAAPLVAVLVLRRGVRVDASQYPAARLLVGLVGLSLIALWNVAVALRPAHRPSLSPRGALGWAGVSVLVVLAWCCLPAPYPMDPALCTGTPAEMVVKCFGWGCLVGAPLLVSTLALNRLSSAQAWLLSAAAAGLAANATLQVTCDHVGVLHVLAGHGLIAAAFVGAAAAVWRVRGV